MSSHIQYLWEQVFPSISPHSSLSIKLFQRGPQSKWISTGKDQSQYSCHVINLESSNLVHGKLTHFAKSRYYGSLLSHWSMSCQCWYQDNIWDFFTKKQIQIHLSLNDVFPLVNMMLTGSSTYSPASSVQILGNKPVLLPSILESTEDLPRKSSFQRCLEFSITSLAHYTWSWRPEELTQPHVSSSEPIWFVLPTIYRLTNQLEVLETIFGCLDIWLFIPWPLWY